MIAFKRPRSRPAYSGPRFLTPFATSETLGAYLAGVEEGRLLVCLVCYRQFMALGIHVRNAHGMSSDEYCQEFGLPVTAGLVAPRTHALQSAAGSSRTADPDFSAIKAEQLRRGRTGPRSVRRPLCPAAQAARAARLARVTGDPEIRARAGRTLSARLRDPQCHAQFFNPAAQAIRSATMKRNNADQEFIEKRNVAQRRRWEIRAAGHGGGEA